VKGYIHAAIALGACAMLATPVFAKEAASKAPQSSARVVLKLNPNGEERKYDSLASAFHQLHEEYGSIGFYGTQVLDYSTFGKKEKLIDAERAYFLVNAVKAKDAGSDFKIVAFASRKAAKAAQTKIGGELRDFEDTWTAVAEHWGVDLNPQPAQNLVAKKEQHEAQREERRSRQAAPAECFT
jgi:NosL